MTSAPPRVREPRQARSRDAWARILRAGTELLEEHGREGLTIAAVCERAGVAPTAIYARVDGIAGLFWAIYEERMGSVLASEEQALEEARALPPGSPERIASAVRAVAGSFEQHQAFLHPIIATAATDPALADLGSQATSAGVARMAAIIGPGGEDVGRFILTACILRSLFGPAWASRSPESLGDFTARLTRGALAMAAQA